MQLYLARLRANPAAIKTLNAYVEINPAVDSSALQADASVGFIPMEAVSDNATGEYAYTPRQLGEVSKGYTPFINGDILWAKITPCMQNGKICLVDNLPNGIGFGSTEFHILRTKSKEILQDFVREFVSQETLRRVATYAFTGSAGHQRVPDSFLAELPFPELEKKHQAQLVGAMDAARAERRAKLAEADALLAGLDGFLLATLGLTPPPKDNRKVFSVCRSELENKQIGANLYAPALRVYLRAFNTGPFPTRKFGNEVAVNPSVSLGGLTEASLVSFVPMEAVEDKASGGVRFQDRELAEVKKGYTPFAEGDVLWAKITPCMENGKSCVVNGLTNKVGFGSTEFHVLRPLSSRVTAEYVHEFVSQSALRTVARFAFTGSAGHQRVPAEFLAELPFPVPPLEIQKRIAAEARRRREEARRLRGEAEARWQTAKRWFEEQLIGPAQP